MELPAGFGEIWKYYDENGNVREGYAVARKIFEEEIKTFHRIYPRITSDDCTVDCRFCGDCNYSEEVFEQIIVPNDRLIEIIGHWDKPPL